MNGAMRSSAVFAGPNTMRLSAVTAVDSAKSSISQRGSPGSTPRGAERWMPILDSFVGP